MFTNYFRIIFCFILLSSNFPQPSKCIDVINSNPISPYEIDYLQKREPVIKEALHNFLNESSHEEQAPLLLGCGQESDYPKIALCLSGGGYRSMIASSGFLLGVQEIGLLDASTYLAALSGSCWNIIPMLAYAGYNSQTFSLETFNQNLQKKVAKEFLDLKTIPWRNILHHIAHKLVSLEKIEPADIWGGLIAGRLMNDLPNSGQSYSFEQIRNLLDTTTMFPFPIFSCSVKNIFASEYDWCEINPYMTGSCDLKFSILTMNVGSYFEKGTIENLKTEESLGFFMGILGSPYDFNFGDILWLIAQTIPEDYHLKQAILDLVQDWIKKYHLNKANFLPTKVYNPTYKMPYEPYMVKELLLADGGFNFNLPFPPLLKKDRNADIIICCDASSDASASGFPELDLAKRYAKRECLNFPSLDHYDKIDKNLFVFQYNKNGNYDHSAPTILYFRNKFAYSTLKLTYSKEEFNNLHDYMKDLVTQNKEAIAAAISKKIECKKIRQEEKANGWFGWCWSKFFGKA